MSGSQSEGGTTLPFRCVPLMTLRAFKDNVRHQYISTKSRSYATTSFRVRVGYLVIHVDDLPYVAWMELTYGYCWYGSVLLRPLVGLTQGSPLAPGICSTVCCYLEIASFWIFERNMSLATKLHARWVDDTYAVITLWYLDFQD